eukprot:m.58832 g.58832  ORF g.58832 m.58832 type:complete len:1139 (-) comp22620_c0_seq1:216-3632(-)
MSGREFDRMYRELSDLKAKESKFNGFKREFAAREANRARDARLIAEEHQKQISEILHDGRLESTRQLQEMRAKDSKLAVLQKEISKLRRNMARRPPSTNGARQRDWEPPSPNGGQSDADLGLYSPLTSPTPGEGDSDVAAAHMAERERLLRKATQADDKAKKARMQVNDLKRQLTSSQAKVSSAEGMQAKLKRDVSSSLDVQRTLRDRITPLEASIASLKKKVKASDGAEKRFQEEQAISLKLRKDIELEYDQMLKDYEVGKKELTKTKAALQKAEVAKSKVEDEVADLKATIAQLRETNTTLKEKATKAVADLAGATTQLAALGEKNTKEGAMDKDNLKQTKESLKTAQNEVKKTQAELKTALADLETANTKLKTFQKGHKQADLDLKATQKEAKKMEAKLESTTSELKKSQADLKQTQAEHKTAKTESQNAKDAQKRTESEVSARNETISKLKRDHEKALSTTKAQIVELEEKLKKKVSSGSDTLKSLQAELFTAGNELREAKLALGSKTSSLEEMTLKTQREIDTLKTEKEAAEKEKRQADGVIAAVEDQVKSLEKELASATAKLDTLQPEFNAANTQIETLTVELAAARDDVKAGEAGVATMTKTITTLEQDLAQALQDLSSGEDDKKKKGSAAVEAAKSRLKRCENKLKESEAKVKDMEAQLKLSVSKSSLVDKNADSKLKSITEKLEQAEKDKTTAQDEVKALTEKVEEAERYKGVVIQAQKDAEEKSERLYKELKEEKAKVAKFSSPLGGMSTSNLIAKAITDDIITKQNSSNQIETATPDATPTQQSTPNQVATVIPDEKPIKQSSVAQEAKRKKLEVAAKKKEKQQAKALAMEQAQLEAAKQKLQSTSKSLADLPTESISEERKVEAHNKFQEKFGSLETTTATEELQVADAPEYVMDDEWRSDVQRLISEFYATDGFFGEAKCDFGGVKKVEEAFADEFSNFAQGDFIKVFEKTEQGYFDGVVLMPGTVGGVFYPEEIKVLSIDEAFAKAQSVVQCKSLTAEDLMTVLAANIGDEQEYDVCIALYDYVPSEQSQNPPDEIELELEFTTGSVLYLLEPENDGYAMAQFEDNKGLIPMNFVAFVAEEDELYDDASTTVTCHLPSQDEGQTQHSVVSIPKDKLLGIRPPEV